MDDLLLRAIFTELWYCRTNKTLFKAQFTNTNKRRTNQINTTTTMKITKTKKPIKEPTSTITDNWDKSLSSFHKTKIYGWQR